VKLVPASTLSLPELTALFNAGYEGYPASVRFDEPAFGRHLSRNDVDLDVSRVAVTDAAAAFALIARRGSDAWVAGMGSVPAARRRGLGERTLTAALQAAALAGTTTVWLEVLDENQAARALYDKLGFAPTRRLVVFTLSGRTSRTSAWQPMTLDAAHAWIVAHRDSREPWQRADESLRHVRTEIGRLTAIATERDGELTAAVIFAEDSTSISILQIVARDRAAAVSALRAVAGTSAGCPVRLVNIAADGTIADAAGDVGGGADHSQWEMRLSLSTRSASG
jgi:ribosomal protein S18 acetylase RimI-like enzyme